MTAVSFRRVAFFVIVISAARRANVYPIKMAAVYFLFDDANVRYQGVQDSRLVALS